MKSKNKFNADDLVEKKLVRKKTYDNGLTIWKYTNKVFYHNLWYMDDRLMQARGIVTDQNDNIVSYGFDKLFNYKENETYIHPTQKVEAIRKVNGFMANLSVMDNEEWLVSTTGTLDSDYAKLAKEVIEKQYSPKCGFRLTEGYTYVFEICDPSDPHIVEEEHGAYLIGIRDLIKNKMVDEYSIYSYSHVLGFHYPGTETLYFGDILSRLKECKHEGYVIRAMTGEHIMKLKSPYYLTKKFLMRMNDNKVRELYENKDKFKKTCDEEFYGFIDYLTDNIKINDWLGYTDQQRRQKLEDFINE